VANIYLADFLHGEFIDYLLVILRGFSSLISQKFYFTFREDIVLLISATGMVYTARIKTVSVVRRTVGTLLFLDRIFSSLSENL
jgi:hypothetical protein